MQNFHRNDKFYFCQVFYTVSTSSPVFSLLVNIDSHHSLFAINIRSTVFTPFEICYTVLLNLYGKCILSSIYDR